MGELTDAVRSVDRLRVAGSDSRAHWRIPIDSSLPTLDLKGLTGLIDFSPADQVVSVRAGTSLQELQEELDKAGQCLPKVAWAGGYSHLNLLRGTVGGDLSLNTPHELMAEYGNWRDWVLGMTVVLADGTVAKAGSHAVKNVAGYDAHKLFIGARGTLGIVAEVVLRTFPVKSLPTPHGVGHNDPRGGPVEAGWVQQVRPSDFGEAVYGSREFKGMDFPNGSWFIRNVPEDRELRRFEGDAVWRSGCGSKNLQITDPTLIRLMKRTKEIFDPSGKLNPGEMGIFLSDK